MTLTKEKLAEIVAAARQQASATRFGSSSKDIFEAVLGRSLLRYCSNDVVTMIVDEQYREYMQDNARTIGMRF